MYKPKVYTASKILRHRLWKGLQKDPDWSHIEWTARWVGIAVREETSTEEDFSHFWTMDIQDVLRSDFVLLYGRIDSDLLRGALVECGAALATGKRVITVGLEKNHSWSYHPLVLRVTSLEEARRFLLTFYQPPAERNTR